MGRGKSSTIVQKLQFNPLHSLTIGEQACYVKNMNERLLSRALVYLSRAERHACIRAYLAVLGISQREIADKAGVDYQRLRKVLSGLYRDRGELDKVEQALLRFHKSTVGEAG